MAHNDPAPLTEAQATAVYNILVKFAGEREDEYSRERFIDAQVAYFQPEYRFMGALDFGGKFRRSARDRWFVDCYSEHLTPARRKIIAVTNAELEKLQAAQTRK
jgi:hypothetical protein